VRIYPISTNPSFPCQIFTHSCAIREELTRSSYDLRRQSSRPYAGRYSLGYQPFTGATRRPSAPTRHTDPTDVLGDLERRARGSSVDQGSNGAACGFDGFLGFGRPIGGRKGEERGEERILKENAEDKDKGGK